MRLLNKIERKIGRFHIPNLMRYIIGGMIVVFVAQLIFSTQIDFVSLITLNREAILRGQVWRLITFIFVPTSFSYIWIFISLYFYYIMGTSLEQSWGGFQFNVYYLLGIIGAIIACFITGYGNNTYLNLSLFLAYATLSPDMEFRVFFLIPLKAKWLALIYAGFLAINLITSFQVSAKNGIQMLVLLGFSLLNYFLFFSRTLIGGIQERIRISRNRRNWQRRNK